MPYDLENPSLKKPIQTPKKPKRRPPYVLVPVHISETVDYLYSKLAARPKRKPKGGFKRKHWKQDQPEGQ
jgi:hypothetical protein